MSYGTFLNEDGTDGGGSFEVFYLDEHDCRDWNIRHLEEDGAWFQSLYGEDREEAIEVEGPYRPGYYWWACYPGCLPDSNCPSGPFETYDLAYQGAEQGAYSEDEIDPEWVRKEDD